MQIKEMFAKKIDREIQGVIIVGQGEDSNVSQELEEYVVTRELQKHFADFYASYKKGIVGTTPKMGVWISGFFGSGKSHFLKILSYLLENRQVSGKKALDYFIDDKKIIDPMVLADMKLAAETPTDVILFNISIEGKSLSNVVIFRLPFPVPDPIIEYKASIAKDPLMDVRVPEMVIKLKQGIGRLIRNFKDTGIVCIIDRRLRDEPPERYHDVTWASLPIKNKTRSLDELRNFYESLPSRHDDVER